MVDGSGHLVATMVLLVHLGQLKISYGPLQFQECRSLTSYVVQGVDPFSDFFFHLFGIDSLRDLDRKFFLKYVIYSL